MGAFNIDAGLELRRTPSGVWASDEAKGFTFSERIHYLKAFGGHAMSFSALQPKMRYFDLEGAGYIAYRKKWGTAVCLGDPVCASGELDRLLDAFLKKYPNPVFIQVSPAVAGQLRKKTGFYATCFGKETVIDLSDWTLSGKKKQVIRTAVNRAAKQGIVVTEGREDASCRALSQSWLETRRCKSREIIFLIRPMEMAYTEGMRRFFAYRGDELIGFIFFDPVYENNRVISYVPNVSRASETFPQGVFYLLMVKAMQQFKKEGIPFIHLGLSPLALYDAPMEGESTALRRMLKFTLRRLNFLYNFKGIDFTKSRFRGTEEPTFAVHNSRVPIKGFVTMFHLCNLI
ncbi:MAG: DUF2156 domain-containing protein [Desulfobacter sp.]|nr:MAG: DUF2156 domain-containing protein [Desulfobacter sp.]